MNGCLESFVPFYKMMIAYFFFLVCLMYRRSILSHVERFFPSLLRATSCVHLSSHRLFPLPLHLFLFFLSTVGDITSLLLSTSLCLSFFLSSAMLDSLMGRDRNECGKGNRGDFRDDDVSLISSFVFSFFRSPVHDGLAREDSIHDPIKGAQ